MDPDRAMRMVNQFGITGVTSAQLMGIGTHGELLIDLYGAAGTPYAPITLYTWRPTSDYPDPDLQTVPGGMLVVSGDGLTCTEFRYLNPQYSAYWSGSPSPAGSGYVAYRSKSPSAGRTDYERPVLCAMTLALPIAPPPQINLTAIHYLPFSWRNRFGDVIAFNHKPNGGSGNGVDYDATWTRNGGSPLASIQVRLQGMPAVSAVPALNTGGGVNSQANPGGRIQVSYPGTTTSTYSLDSYVTYGTYVDMTGICGWGGVWTKPWDAFRRHLQPYRLTVDNTGEYVQFDYAVACSDPINMFIPVTLKSLTFPNRKQTFTWQPYKYRRPPAVMAYLIDPVLTDIYTAGGVSLVADQDLTMGGQTRTTSYERVVPIPDSSRPSGPFWTSTAFWVAVTHPDGHVITTRFAEPINGTQISLSTPSNNYQSLAHLKHQPVDERTYSPGMDWRSDLTAVPGQSTAYRVTQFGAPLVGTPGTPDGEASRFAVGSNWVNPYWNFVTAYSPAATLGNAPYSTRQETWEKDGPNWAVRHRIESRGDWDASGGGWKTQTLTADFGDSPLIRTISRSYESDWANWFLGRKLSEQKPGQPAVNFTYNADNSLHQATVNQGGTPEVDTSYVYTGGLPDPTSVTQTSSNLALSGQYGISHEFDTYGLVNKITPLGVNWSVEEIHDSFGRPTQQTGANSETTSIQWDAVGRLSSVQVVPEVSTEITYPDLLTAVVTHGAQQMTYHYNGFGELVKTDRQGGSQTFQYDYEGRKLLESVWGGTSGTQYQYDNQGRVGTVTDPNGEVVHYYYEGPKKRVVHGGIETQFIYDGLGQLAGVTDALGQGTSYYYDQAGRVTKVTQAGTSGTQVRNWAYNGMGWLYQLTQPESGTTTYSDFTIHGKAQTTDYNGRSVTTNYDSLGRATSIISADGTVNFGLAYDELGHGSSNGKLTTATEMIRGVTRSLHYRGLNGRLSDLNYTIDGLPPFTQGIGYDANNYGFIASRTYPDGSTQSFTYDEAKGLPNWTGFGGSNLASLFYDPIHWGLTNITYANNAFSTYGYDSDQVRLKTMSHVIPSAFTKTWTYTYDSAGRMTNDTEDWFFYDALGRLTTAYVRDPWDTSSGHENHGVMQQFAYDSFGNRTGLNSKMVLNWAAGATPPDVNQATTDTTSKAQTYTFNPLDAALSGNNQLPAYASNGAATGAQYDLQGNLTGLYKLIGDSTQALSMTYDALGRVKTMSDSILNTTEVYTYDDQGLRVMVEVYQGPVAIQNLQKKKYQIYNEARQLTSEYELEAE
ncbi:hypothetical protein [Geothrix limicola]|uniref:hypothetical protein n=1 Tax=Geothrix limicola TaxID=2927978 RepID=UPI0025542498|nr:hypothetical protein [Geothrix limicola]